MKLKRLMVATLVVASLGIAPGAAAIQTEEVLDLVAMPLAVAAVSEIAGVPTNDLVQLIAAMNDTDVAPGQFVEIVRYSPVLLVDPIAGPEMVTLVTNEVNRGITDDELVRVLTERIRATGIEGVNLDDRSNIVIDRRVIVPDTVVRHVEEVRNHPHGGPPGQIKKDVGVQTGAEIVHGTKPGERRSIDDVNDRENRPNAKPDRKTGPPPHAAKDGKPEAANKGKAKGKAKGNAKGKDESRGDR